MANDSGSSVYLKTDFSAVCGNIPWNEVAYNVIGI